MTCFDSVFNQLFLSTANLQALGFPTQLTVVSTPDTTSPQITGFSINPSSVDVSSSPQTVTFTLDLMDDLSGVDFGVSRYSAASLIMQSPSGRQTQVIGNDKFTQISGTPSHGSWQTTLTLPQNSEAGTWTLQRLFLDDAVGNFELLNAANLQARGLSPTLSVTSSPADISPPRVTTLTMSPALIDTSIGPQSVRITIEAADDLAGVSFTPSWPFTTCDLEPANSLKRIGLLLVSPSGGQTRCLEPDFGFGSSAIDLISGTPQDGVWQGSIFFPQFSEGGTWKASLILKDAVENFISYDTAGLQALGISTDLVVIKPSLDPDGTLPPTGGTVSDAVFGSRAQVTAPPGVLNAPTTVAIDVLTSPLAIPIPSGYSGAGTYFVNIQLTPSFPLPPPGLIVVLPLFNPMPPGNRIDLYRVEPATGMLVPSLDWVGQPIVGAVDVGGQSATFIGIVRLSTVVGLVPVISVATPIVTVTGGTFTYDGTARAATATATGIGGVLVPGSFSFSYLPGGSSAPVNAGTYMVTATFTSGDPHYTNASGTGTITINRATATIAWTPADLVEGTPVGAAQLNATANAPGTLTYTPPAGTLLNDGVQTLTVSFTPSDPSNYDAASKTVTIHVSPTAGRLEGEGRTDAAGIRYEFVFYVLERSSGAERGALRLEVERIGRAHKGTRIGTFVTTSINPVVFSDDPRFRPSPHRQPVVDTATFSGVGRWNGIPGYTFTAQASDTGKMGHDRDLFAITIRDPHGVTVATVSGPITHGDIESSRMP